MGIERILRLPQKIARSVIKQEAKPDQENRSKQLESAWEFADKQTARKLVEILRTIDDLNPEETILLGYELRKILAIEALQKEKTGQTYSKSRQDKDIEEVQEIIAESLINRARRYFQEDQAAIDKTLELTRIIAIKIVNLFDQNPNPNPISIQLALRCDVNQLHEMLSLEKVSQITTSAEIKD